MVYYFSRTLQSARPRRRPRVFRLWKAGRDFVCSVIIRALHPSELSSRSENDYITAEPDNHDRINVQVIVPVQPFTFDSQ